MGLYYDNYSCDANTTNNINSSLKINAVSGKLTKTYPKSYFAKFEAGSVEEHFYFRTHKPSKIIGTAIYISGEEPEEYERYDRVCYKTKEIVIIQIMPIGNDWHIIELMDKEDFDKMFET